MTIKTRFFYFRTSNNFIIAELGLYHEMAVGARLNFNRYSGASIRFYRYSDSGVAYDDKLIKIWG